MRLFHDNSEGLIAIPRWRAERLGQGSFGSKSGKARSEHIPSGLPPRADIVDALKHFRQEPTCAPQRILYSICSSAISRRLNGTSMSSARTAFRLMARPYFRRRLHRQVPGFSALENAIDVNCRLPELFNEVDGISHQAAFPDVGDVRVNRRHPMAVREIEDELAMDAGE